MKRYRETYLLLFLIVFCSFTVAGQHSKAINKIVKNCMGEYEQDGKERKASLDSGEETELYRAFDAGKIYKIMVLNVQSNESIHVTAYDETNNVIYTGDEKKKCGAWVFEPDSSVFIKFVIKAPENGSVCDVVFIVGSVKSKKK